MVYFVQGEKLGLIKIGYCIDITRFKTRLQILQIGSPDKLKVLLVVEEYPHDGMLHGYFKEIRSHGEWFRPEKCLLDFISKARTNSISAWREMESDRGYVWSTLRRANFAGNCDRHYKKSEQHRARWREKLSNCLAKSKY